MSWLRWRRRSRLARPTRSAPRPPGPERTTAGYCGARWTRWRAPTGTRRWHSPSRAVTPWLHRETPGQAHPLSISPTPRTSPAERSNAFANC
eukprot:3422307-Pleurochrysis_carterae.AAC.1